MAHGRNVGARVRVFIDYSNFMKRWQAVTGSYPDVNLRWDAFPGIVMDHLTRMDHVPDELELRAIKIYASIMPFDEVLQDSPVASEEDQVKLDQAISSERILQKWLQENLDQLPGYTVDLSTRINSPVMCYDCGISTPHYVEHGVDTKIAIDLLALATRDLYDIGVLITEDSDLVPSTRCVQEVLDKHIVHLGFASPKSTEKSRHKEKRKEDLRSVAWGHLLLDDMLIALLR